MMQPSAVFTPPAVLPQLARLDWRIPSWGEKELPDRSCPICGAHNEAVLSRPDGLPLAYCAACGVWYVASMPAAENLEKFYQKYWCLFREAVPNARAAMFMRWAARRNARKDIRINRLAAILGNLRGERVVDVGCGLGAFLLTLEAAGAQPFGIEISQQAREFVTQKFHIPVWADLSECLAENRKFGAIVLNDLIEHLPNPAALLETVVARLRPGGVLAIWTPNGGAAGQNLASAREWVGFRVDLEHLQYLSSRTVMQLAKKLGLSVEHLETTGFPSLAAVRGGRCSQLLRTSERLWDSLTKRGQAAKRTTGTYHLFAVLKKT